MTDLPVDPDEEMLWSGRPSPVVVVPALMVGLVLVVGAAVLLAVVGLTQGALLGAAGLVVVGVAVPAVASVVVRYTRYAVTSGSVYTYRAVLGRRLSQSGLDRVTDSTFAQSAVERALGVGTVTFELAGGQPIRFRGVAEPERVRRLVDQRAGTETLPGTVAEWEAVLSEVRAVRRAFEDRG